ncbi:MAG: Gx transporter family protein [Treponema sp.]|nr:Gx transporter family protein [Treponema sp.]
MPFLNKITDAQKKRIAYLGALSLLFSYAEMLLPRIIPFFRLGLGNIIILLALNLQFFPFLTLILIKTVAACLMNGTLFSPFFLISFAQSLSSGLFMFLLFKINKKILSDKLLSLYGISLCGSAVSAVVQIFISSLYLGKQTLNLMGPMLLFSVFSALVTAFATDFFEIPTEAPIISIETGNEETQNKQPPKIFFIILGIALTIIIAVVFCLKNLYLLIILLLLSVIGQILCKRKLLILPHIYLWIFVVLSSLLIPNGQVLFSIGNWSITKGAILVGIEKALKLSIVSCLSQCMASMRTSGNSLVGLTLQYFKGLSNIFRQSDGNLIKKINTTLSTNEIRT